MKGVGVEEPTKQLKGLGCALGKEVEYLTGKLITTAVSLPSFRRNTDLTECPVSRELGHDLHFLILKLPAANDGVGSLRRSSSSEKGNEQEENNAGDASSLETALREAREEVGLTRDAIKILAELPAVETLTTGFRIVPFLARVTPPPQWVLQEGEIAEILEPTVRDLTRPEARGEDVVRVPNETEPLPISFYRVGSYRLWGASHWILEPLLPRLLAREWEI